jgi:galactose-1-phosphate uridylyltransferase
VVDVADLSEGFSFINKNLYPVLYPTRVRRLEYPEGPPTNDPGSEGMASFGMHFLQWTSSQHDMDWHNMPPADRIIAMQRLAALEKKLVINSVGPCGYVSIIKNYGHLVGGSLVHGHQQIVLSNVMPRRMRDNWLFEEVRGERFSAYLLRENPVELTLRDYGPAVLVVPYFMRRPLDMMLLLKDIGKSYLHQLADGEIAAVADGWHDAIRVLRKAMPEIGRELAYNITTNNGPGAGLYFEFLPYSQEMGGLEHLGLFVCQQSPQGAAGHIRQILGR